MRELAEALKHVDGPLLPILHSINDRFGYVDERAIPIVAEVLNISRADVHGVVSFYHDFRKAPPKRRVIKICRAEACQSMGGDELYDEVSKACGAGSDVTVEAVYCLGNCALSPVALVDGKIHGRLDTEQALALVRS
ncbi:MAG: formate dehydrogenase subunit gamma [Rhodospirillales bacterium]|nr:formate dehydrogenase subunit gamma [Rhodospirillales bacterium]